MCGIIGAVAQRNVAPILIEGLKRLEYRGYDSAGVALLQQQEIHRIRTTGRVVTLEEAVRKQGAHGITGIAHTRWATHGAPTEDNAHPHVSGGIAVVHNGIIENHEVLRAELRQAGYVFVSQTDTEVIAHLVHFYFKTSQDLFAATREAVARLHGAYAIGVVCNSMPNKLVAARQGSPLLIGVGVEEHFIASDASALLPVTQRFIYLEDGDIAEIGLTSIAVQDKNGQPAEREIMQSEMRPEMVELGEYRHYMQKEIHEQPRALSDTLQELVTNGIQPMLYGPEGESVLSSIERITFLACGTSYHAALTARYWIEALAGIPCNAEIASEYRYRTSVPDPKALIVTISQSGETADTLSALKHAQSLGHNYSLAICNVSESALVRESRLNMITRAGPEIGVASTKAFTTQLAALFTLALVLAKLRGKIDAAAEQKHLEALRALPGQMQRVLALEGQIQKWSEHFAEKQHALFLGRGLHYPIALEGALKLKEISYIHAEAYPAGELKHGPLALVDKDMPVIAIAPNDALLEKLKSNLQEVRARGGELYVVVDEDTHIQEMDEIHKITLPLHAGWLSPILHVVPLQMLSYHAALQKGTDVDKPRNLAKSVTVE